MISSGSAVKTARTNEDDFEFEDFWRHNETQTSAFTGSDALTQTAIDFMDSASMTDWDLLLWSVNCEKKCVIVFQEILGSASAFRCPNVCVVTCFVLDKRSLQLLWCDILFYCSQFNQNMKANLIHNQIERFLKKEQRYLE